MKAVTANLGIGATAIAEWVDWFNNQRLHTAIGDISPHEHEIN
ncbi:IS3 family transposase [Streptomyces tagetis]|uniref:IS3 family transposase n=1 Tax=Streptomyces tagetis TaxID=2820809 RepID=A0A940XBW2_9ACTN|nr:IS3 family transposase [Streptomyces sp. RG38]MBQ0827463.1 IS3 family transposase [Streptomyces sp. RG38]